MKPFISAICLLSSVFCLPAAALTDAWTADVRQHTAIDRTYKQGETVTMQITLREGFSALDLTGATACFYWYTNAVQNVWWTNAVAFTSPKTGVVSMPWTPAMDTGAAAYPYWVGIWPAGATSPLWRVTGSIRLLKSPGFRPNVLALPVRTLDFAGITVTNAPWVTATAWQSGSNALSVALQSVAEAQTQASALIESNRQAIAAIPPPSTDALRLATPDGTQWRDATGAVWRVTYETTTNVICTFSNPFGRMTGPDMYDRPNEAFYISAPNTQVDADNYWLINFDSANEGLWNVFNYQWGIWWAASGYELPLVAHGGMGECVGTALFDYAFTYTAVTSRVDTVALLSDLAALPAPVPAGFTNAPLYSLGGSNYFWRWDSSAGTYTITGVPQ